MDSRMPRIQHLSPLVVSQIAAGEVIERPASVVKELLENALDAGGSRIDVDVAQGGTGLIRVVDNGSGIAADDLPLAFASHATSKLAALADLARIGTLGFRGEALASIGSIAQVTLQSRPPEQPCGAEIACHGGQLSPVRGWNGTPGTRIEVKHLFYNTPARRKFLKGPGVEMGHVSEAFIRLALTRMGLHWTLRHNGRLVYEVPASLGLLDRIGLFFGAEVASSLYLMQAEQGQVVVGGYLGDPALERASSQLQYLFVNDRWVRDRGLFQAVQDAYRGLLMTGRHPVAFLFVELPADQVDVNVHPAKAEVRFRDREVLHQLVHDTVRARLQEADLAARMQLGAKKEGLPAAEVSSQAPLPSGQPAQAAPNPGDRGEVPRPRDMPGVARSTASPAAAPGPGGAPGTNPQAPAHVLGQAAEGPGSALPLTDGPLRALQVLDCYLVVEVPPDEVLFFDQHALHERLLYEDFQQRVRAGSVEMQRLLVPETITLPAAQAAAVLAQRAALAELGLAVEDFGGGTVLLTGYPALLGQRPPQAVLQAVADYLVTRERAPDREQLLHDLLSLMACHAAVRAGDRLTAEKIAALVARRDLAQDSHHCPHGRPTVLRLSRRDLDRHFRRL
jgi:DNA mismatch repair protein MutL